MPNSASTDRKTQLSATGNAQDIAGYLKNLGPQLVSSGVADTKAGVDDTAKASRYYSDILSGDPSKVMAAVQPEVDALNKQTEQEKQVLTNSGNRSGGTNAAAQDLTSRNRSVIGDVVSRARSGAASGLERTGGQTSSVGLSETGQGIGASSTAGSEFQNLINSAITSRQASQKIHDAAVEDWGKVIGDVLMAAGGV